jgi:2-amino-4-hydroxy-6-hydroxymethyldihydropteridine diphosphokinase
MPVTRGEERAYLGLGSNLGDRLLFLQRGASALQRREVVVQRASSVYTSTYVGPGPPQPPYLNAVLEITTTLLPLELLDVAQDVERCMGRPEGTHMQPRRLDVDLLLVGDHRCTTPRLTLPHPRLSERRFVLEPLLELGVLEAVPIAGLAQRLEQLRHTQQVDVWGAWPGVRERHGSHI